MPSYQPTEGNKSLATLDDTVVPAGASVTFAHSEVCLLDRRAGTAGHLSFVARPPDPCRRHTACL